jgi:molybdopterin molybdotransferase
MSNQNTETPQVGVEAALDLIYQHDLPTQTEQTELADSYGRILAEDGDAVLRSGDLITATKMGVLGQTGHAKILVYKQPRVAVLATGSGLVAIDQKPKPAQVRDSNTYALAGAITEAGAEVVILPFTKTPEELAETLSAAASSHDAIVVTGGVTESDSNYTATVISELGQLLFTEIDMNPGKPLSFGVISGTPIFGLPSSLEAALIDFEVLVRPALRKMQGLKVS